MSKLYRFKRVQLIPASVEDVWEFISAPVNLKKITPPSMDFTVLTTGEEDVKMYPGMIIAYKVRPLPFYNTTWVTEITHVEPLHYFVDEQRFGPYALWHHKHFVKPVKGGTEMIDIVDYKIPFGFMGDIANELLVKKKLNEIFSFRVKAVESIFGVFKSS